MKKLNYNGGNMINNEIWKDVIGFEQYYQISSFGRVKSKQRKIICGKAKFIKDEKILKNWKSKVHNNDYYYYITFSVNAIHYKKSIHRLVAENFILNPLNLKEINHKDGNKQNNNVENLEWVTTKENQNHSWNVLKRKRYKQEYYKLINKICLLKEKLLAHGDWQKVEAIFKDIFENEQEIELKICELVQE